jgi:hypothetical protein
VSFTKVLVAVDESAVAAQLATALGAQLALVSVVDPPQTVAPDSGVPAADLIALAEKDAGDSWLGSGNARRRETRHLNSSPSGNPLQRSPRPPQRTSS